MMTVWRIRGKIIKRLAGKNVSENDLFCVRWDVLNLALRIMISNVVCKLLLPSVL